MKQDARRAPTQSTLVVRSRMIRLALLGSRLSGNDHSPRVREHQGDSSKQIPPRAPPNRVDKDAAKDNDRRSTLAVG